MRFGPELELQIEQVAFRIDAGVEPHGGIEVVCGPSRPAQLELRGLVVDPIEEERDWTMTILSRFPELQN